MTIRRVANELYLKNVLKTTLQRRATYQSSDNSKLSMPSQLEVNVRANASFAKWSRSIVR